MKTWDWWVPWVFSAVSIIVTMVATRRSQSFKELTEVKNTYKMRVQDLEKEYKGQKATLTTLEQKVDSMQNEMNAIKTAHIGCKQALEYAEKRAEDMLKFFEKHINGKPVNGLETDGPVS